MPTKGGFPTASPPQRSAGTAPAPEEPPGPERRRGRLHPARFNTFVSLRHRDFLLLWLSNLCNASAVWFQQITIPWVVWEISGSPFLVGIAAGMRSIPFLVIGPMAGVFADRVDRRKMVLVTQSVMAMVVLAFAGGVQLGMVVGTLGVIYALAFSFITGTIHSLIQPVRQAMVANTVPREDLWNAVALNSIAGNVARVVGPGLGGVLIAWLGPALNFFLEGVLYVLMVLVMIPIALPYREAITARRASMMANLKQGFSYVLSEQVVLRLLLVACISDILLAPVIHLMPVIATEVLGQGSEVYGFLVLATGVGGIISTISFASLGGVFRRGSVGLLALMLLSASAILLGFSTWVWLSLVAMFGFGFFRLAFKINNNTLVQTTIPDALRGRVMSIYHLDHGLTPLASMTLGLIAEFWPANFVVVLVGVISLVLTIYAFIAYSDMRRMS
ncbi:MAG: MFS transporter [Chloroflexota bacterium]|nr:MFS transporter [Chloroflexota bacterium]